MNIHTRARSCVRFPLSSFLSYVSSFLFPFLFFLTFFCFFVFLSLGSFFSFSFRLRAPLRYKRAIYVRTSLFSRRIDRSSNAFLTRFQQVFLICTLYRYVYMYMYMYIYIFFFNLYTYICICFYIFF